MLHSNFFKSIFIIFSIIFVLMILISASYICISNVDSYSSLDGEFVWPLPGYSYISSYFGKRNSPTVGASTFHSGIDIPAPNGTAILAICSGEVTFCSWGAGGRLYDCY